MKSKLKLTIAYLSCLSLAMISSGCFGSSKGGTLLDGRLNDESAPPYTEVLIEYPGPSQKWAGPPSVYGHLTSQAGKPAKLVMSHLGAEQSELTSAFKPETAKEQIEHLRYSAQNEVTPSASCSSPVKVRLVRADGAVISKNACRGQVGWPRVASEITANWMSTAFQGPAVPAVSVDAAGHKATNSSVQGHSGEEVKKVEHPNGHTPASTSEKAAPAVSSDHKEAEHKTSHHHD